MCIVCAATLVEVDLFDHELVILLEIFVVRYPSVSVTFGSLIVSLCLDTSETLTP